MTRNRIVAAGLLLACGCGATDGGTMATVAAPTAGGAGRAAIGTAGTLAGTAGRFGTAGTTGAVGMPTVGTAGRAAGGIGTAGTMAVAAAGRGAAGTPGAAGTGTVSMMMGVAGTMAKGTGGMAAVPPKVMTATDPMIPDMPAQCPSLETGPTEGVDGQVQSGPMPAEATAPMLLYWHGTGSTSGEYAFMDADVSNGVISQGGIIVSFQGTTNQGDCSPSGTFIFCTGDFDIMDKYVACGVKTRHVDPHRIYTAGCSAGGLMATAMAMQRSQYIAAACPNSGGVAIPGMFSSDHTPGLMTRHGAPGSDVVIVDFSQTSATADMLFKSRMGVVIDCNTGGGHCGAGGLSPDCWTFFQAHPYGVSPEPYSGSLPAGFSPQCMLQ